MGSSSSVQPRLRCTAAHALSSSPSDEPLGVTAHRTHHIPGLSLLPLHTSSARVQWPPHNLSYRAHTCTFQLPCQGLPLPSPHASPPPFPHLPTPRMQYLSDWGTVRRGVWGCCLGSEARWTQGPYCDRFSSHESACVSTQGEKGTQVRSQREHQVEIIRAQLGTGHPAHQG